jgi:PAS domain S-box-containing protein/putative nucleotidyltransferase with HDIG domain
MIFNSEKDNGLNIRYQKLFDSIVDGILILSYPDGNIKDANESIEIMLGYERSDLIDRNFWEMNLIACKDDGLDAYATLLKGQEVKLTNVALQTKDGSQITADLSGEMYKLDHKAIIQLNIHSKTEIQALKNEIGEFRRMSEKTTDQMIQALLTMTKFRDPYTASHQIGVSKLATAIAKEMNLNQHETDGLCTSSLVHDIGKISIPTEILTKPSALNTYETALLKNHVKVGFDILKGLQFPWQVAKIVLQHHERNDGSGYPNQLTEIEICKEAKILAVADTIEAMAHFRPYRPALGIEAALYQIEIEKGYKLDPAAVDACINLFRLRKFSFDEILRPS